MAVVVAALRAFSAELTRVAPRRTLPDWFEGDQDHASGPSGHNPDETGRPEDTDADSIDEIRAGDYRLPLNHPTLTMEKVAQFLVSECRAGRVTWIKYVIFNRRIWAASSGWVQRAYAGANPHDQHMHVSCKPTTAAENSTRIMGLSTLVEEPDVALTNDEIKRIAHAVLFETPMPGTEDTPGGWQRNLAQTVGDPWSVTMRGKTLGGDPVPTASPTYATVAALSNLVARPFVTVQDLAAIIPDAMVQAAIDALAVRLTRQSMG